MHYVILRDDDTCALTPAACLERLYRPFLDRGLPVNLATIPEVRTDVRRFDGLPEGFLQFRNGTTAPRVPLAANRELTGYLQRNPLYRIVQHGYDHSLLEFDGRHGPEMARRLDAGAHALVAAGFPAPQTFVAPYDRLSRPALRAVAARYRVLSTGWFEWRRLPPAWWPAYAWKKLRRQPHWRAGRTLLLSHPGCLLSRFRPRDDLLERIPEAVAAQSLTVLVTHWWEYFPDGKPDEEFIRLLHRTAEWLAAEADVRVVSFDDLAQRRVPLPA